MNREKWPSYFLAVCVLYALVFLAGFSYFIVPLLGFGFAHGDFTLILLLMLLPMILLAAYTNIGRIEFLWGKERAIRSVVSAIVAVDFFIVLVMMILLIG